MSKYDVPTVKFHYMEWESPVEVITKDIIMKAVEKMDENIYQAVLETKVIVDKDSLVRAIQGERNQYEKGYADGFANADKEIANQIFKDFQCLMDDNEVWFHQTDKIREDFANLKKKYTESEDKK